MLQEMLVRNCNCMCTTDMEWEGDGWDGVYTGEVLWRVHWWSVVECVCWESVSGKEGDGWEDVGEWKSDANNLSCHTGFSYFGCYV